MKNVTCTCLAMDLLSALLYTFLIFARVNWDIALAFKPNTTFSSATKAGSGSDPEIKGMILKI